MLERGQGKAVGTGVLWSSCGIKEPRSHQCFRPKMLLVSLKMTHSSDKCIREIVCNRRPRASRGLRIPYLALPISFYLILCLIKLSLSPPPLSLLNHATLGSSIICKRFKTITFFNSNKHSQCSTFIVHSVRSPSWRECIYLSPRTYQLDPCVISVSHCLRDWRSSAACQIGKASFRLPGCIPFCKLDVLRAGEALILLSAACLWATLFHSHCEMN